MRVLKAGEFVEILSQLQAHLHYSNNWDPDEVIDKDVAKELLMTVSKATRICADLELTISEDRLRNHIRMELLGQYGDSTWGRLQNQLRTFKETLQIELSSLRFAAVERKRLDCFDSVHAAEGAAQTGPHSKEWLKIWDSFPSVEEEAREAVYCYALDRNTACVFHSMRIAEIGLRALARRMRVTLPKRKKLEWGDWQQIIKGMSTYSDKLGNSLKAGPRKDDVLDFYSGAIGQFNGFKDEFRNQVMHVRRSYDEFDAESALTRVRTFMYKLARKIDEKGRILRS